MRGLTIFWVLLFLLPSYGQIAEGYAELLYSKNNKKVRKITITDDSSIVTNIVLNRIGQIRTYSVHHTTLNEKVEIKINKLGNIKSFTNFYSDTLKEKYFIRNGKPVHWASYQNDTMVESYKRMQDEYKTKIADTGYTNGSYTINTYKKPGVAIQVDPDKRQIQSILFGFSDLRNDYHIKFWKKEVAECVSLSIENKILYKFNTMYVHAGIFDISIARNYNLVDGYQQVYDFNWRGKLKYVNLYNFKKSVRTTEL